MTSSKYLDEETAHEEYCLEDVRTHLSAGRKLLRNEEDCPAFQEYGKKLWLFVDGRQYTYNDSVTEQVKTLCPERIITPEVCVALEGHDSLLLDLLNHGSVYLSD